MKKVPGLLGKHRETKYQIRLTSVSSQRVICDFTPFECIVQLLWHLLLAASSCCSHHGAALSSNSASKIWGCWSSSRIWHKPSAAVMDKMTPNAKMALILVTKGPWLNSAPLHIRPPYILSSQWAALSLKRVKVARHLGQKVQQNRTIKQKRPTLLLGPYLPKLDSKLQRIMEMRLLAAFPAAEFAHLPI